MLCAGIRWMLPDGKKTMGRKRHQKKPSKKDYSYIKKKLTSNIYKGLTILEIKGRDKSPLIIVRDINLWGIAILSSQKW